MLEFLVITLSVLFNPIRTFKGFKKASGELLFGSPESILPGFELPNHALSSRRSSLKFEILELQWEWSRATEVRKQKLIPRIRELAEKCKKHNETVPSGSKYAITEKDFDSSIF